MKYSGSTIDVLLATYNGDNFISEQIVSILKQSYINFNLLICDDCSSDLTYSILEKYAKTDSRIRLYSNKENIGIQKNFEKLIELSKADFFMLCDQDDIWDENKIEKLHQKIIDTDSLLVYSDMRVVDSSLNKISHSFWKYESLVPVTNNNWKIILSQNVITGCTIIARKDLKKFILPFPENLVIMHDWWIGLNAAIYGKIFYINDTFQSYRQHEKNQVGASSFESKLNDISDYSAFQDYRKKYIKQMLSFYKLLNSHLEINSSLKKEITELIKYYQYFDKIRVLDYKFISIWYKVRFSSIGFKRNIWWILCLGFPWIAYLSLLSSRKFLNVFKSNSSGGEKK